MKQTILFLILALCATFAHAQYNYSMTFTTVSKHYGADGVPCNYQETGKEHAREVNPGIGFQVEFNREWSVEQAIYANSAWNTSYAVLGKWTPIDHGWYRLGIGFGGATGYCAKPVMGLGGLVASFDISRHWGADVLLTPPIGNTDGVVALQLKYRLW